MERTLRIAVLAPAGSIGMGVIGCLDVLRKADRWLDVNPQLQTGTRLQAYLVSEQETWVEMGCGIRLEADYLLEDSPRPHLILVPPVSDTDLLAGTVCSQKVTNWLLDEYRAGSDIAAMCLGSFALAETGLLDHKRAATHWAYHELFRSRYPQIELMPDAILLDEGRIMTGGGASAFLNMLIYVLEKYHSPGLASLLAKVMLLDLNKAPQRAYAIFGGQHRHGDKQISQAQSLLEANAAEDLNLEQLAEQVNLSERTLMRRFKQATGDTPYHYLQRVRVEQAKQWLSLPNDTVETIAYRVGYTDLSAFRKVFKTHTGLSPSEYRERYCWQPNSAA